MKIKITSLTRVRKPKPNKSGDTIVARFDCKVDWLTLNAACLVKKASNGGLIVWTPMLPDDQPWNKSIEIDPPVRRKIAAVVSPIYEALGGEICTNLSFENIAICD